MNRIPRNLLLLVALVSIGFNLFFIAGYRRARSTLDKLKTDRGYIQLLSRRLDFTPEQEERLVAIKGDLQKEIEAFNKAHSPEIEAFWDEMVKDAPRPAELEALEKALSAKRLEMRRRVVERIREAFACLTPEQRRDLARIIKERSFLKQL
jgi:Spy/CpxP family protein refolding chaperone